MTAIKSTRLENDHGSYTEGNTGVQEAIFKWSSSSVGMPSVCTVHKYKTLQWGLGSLEVFLVKLDHFLRSFRGQNPITYSNYMKLLICGKCQVTTLIVVSTSSQTTSHEGEIHNF